MYVVANVDGITSKYMRPEDGVISKYIGKYTVASVPAITHDQVSKFEENYNLIWLLFSCTLLPATNQLLPWKCPHLYNYYVNITQHMNMKFEIWDDWKIRVESLVKHKQTFNFFVRVTNCTELKTQPKPSKYEIWREGIFKKKVK